jgi:hypothetical protein
VFTVLAARPVPASSPSELDGGLGRHTLHRAPGDRSTVYLSNPIEAITAVRAAGYPNLQLLGDWHSHTVRGSELPSLADARAWAGTMDSLGRDAYVSVIVSPSEEQGWMFPKFSAWVAGHHNGAPIVGSAHQLEEVTAKDTDTEKPEQPEQPSTEVHSEPASHERGAGAEEQPTRS